MVKNKDLFIAIDGNAIVHRAFHAYPPTLVTSDGLQVNAVYGFTVMLLQVLKQFEPKYVVCAFDTSKPTFRHTKFPAYKAQRKPTDQSLIDQFPLVEQVLTSLNIPILKKEGYEADDILGTISKWVDSGKWNSYDYDMYLVTGDRDFLQLIGEKVKVCIPQGSFNSLTTFDRESSFQRYGYYPEQVIEYKGLVGDTSDNIPGIKGVGEKTAMTLLNKYNTLEGIYSNINELKGRTYTLISEGYEQAVFSRDLATINRDVDIQLNLEDCVLQDFDEDKVISLLTRFEFRSLISKLPKSNRQETKGGQLGMFGLPEADTEQVVDAKNLQIYAMISDEESSTTGFEFEVLVDNEGKLSTNISKGFTKVQNSETWFFGFEEWIAKNDSQIEDIPAFFDIKMLSHMLSSGKKKYDISTLAFDYASKNIPEKISTDDIGRVGKVLIEIVQGIKERMHKTLRSEYVQKWMDKLEEKFAVTGLNGYELVHNYVDVPLAKSLAKMERRGVLLDMQKLKALSDEITSEVEKTQKTIFEEIGHEFNLNSPKQLSDVLFTELSLPSNYQKSTREDILQTLVGMHPSIELILSYRELTKILNTYLTPFLQTEKKDGEYAVHSDFKMTGSSSGRFASVNPNMQNIPARGKWAGRIREIFVPREGFEMIGADYSQIEFRIMADVSNDSVLVDDFRHGKDIHTSTASRILGKDEKEVSKEDRNLGKTINFAILFGQTPFGLSRLANIDTTLAKKYIEEYFKTYSGVKEYIDMATETARKYGYAQSMFGRTRHIAGLSSKNKNVLSAAIREAINMPIQGGEADIMRLAMVEIQKLIDTKFKDTAYMQLQVHDELIFEAKKEVSEEFMASVRDIMENIVTLNVPLEVHISKGMDMGQLK